MATLCCCPPDNCKGNCPALSSRPTLFKRAIAFSSASSLDFFRSFLGPRVRLSKMLMWGKRLNCWNTIPIFCRKTSTFLLRNTLCPSKKTSPFVGLSKAFKQRRKVDFPEPEGPIILITSPLWISTEISCKTSWFLNFLWRCSTLIKTSAIFIPFLFFGMPLPSFSPGRRRTWLRSDRSKLP